MARRAFCVGINDYPYDDSDLNGCVNDARAWAKLLMDHYDFPSSEVKVITDSEATKANMVAGMKSLLAGASSGDALVFTNSSHGTYVAESGGDEPLYDEALCPHDTDRNLLVDDELREMFADIPDGVSFIVISDSCHSGTVTRVAPSIPVPDERRRRFLNPRLLGNEELEDPFEAPPRRWNAHPQSGMREILLTGCTDKEYSYDARIGGTYHGAMTYFALQAIREANYRITYAQLRTRVNYLLDQSGYPQHPQLEGKWRSKQRQIFS